MILKCFCGNQLDDIGYPNNVENLLVSTEAEERLQDMVDKEVNESGEIQMWPEHWEESNAISVWKCYECNRLYFNPEGEPEKVIVYNIEQVGIDSKLRSRYSIDE
jgi:hypothetical protein